MEDIHVIDGDTFESVEMQLKKARDEILKSQASGGKRSMDIGYTNFNGYVNHAMDEGPEGQNQMEEVGDGEFALVINGHSLVRFLSE